MSGLLAKVDKGKLEYEASEETKSATVRGSSELGKDSFLQLLVCQMQHQDPLEPNTDTEFVSQLATFSQLEQLQNLSGETEKSQAFSLVGKYVILTAKDSNGNVTYPEGIVDFVNMSGGEVKLSIDGATYDYEQLRTVVGDAYYVEQSLPKIDTEYKYSYNALSPKDFAFEVNFGRDDFKASEIALVLNGEQIDTKYIKYDNNKITIDNEAFSGLPNGEYKGTVVFNNPQYTQIVDKVIVNVYNSEVTEEQAKAAAEARAAEQAARDAAQSEAGK